VWCDTANIIILGLFMLRPKLRDRHYLTSNKIPLANRTHMLFLQSGVLPHFNSAAINNSASTFQN